MVPHLSRRAFGAVAVGSLAAPAVLRAAEPLRIRCSLDTAASHPRNVACLDYLAKVEKASGGEIVGEVFHSGALFADLNVGKALLQGQIEMAVPGGWTQTGLVPDCDVAQLPFLYGVSVETTYAATDGKAGQHVNRQLEAKLGSHVLGPWIDLGYQNWYSTKTRLDGFAALKGLKIRSPGGSAISWRIKFAGGIANTTAWPNVPLALSQGTFDAFVSTDESCNSAKLWEAGVKYSYADHQFMGQYIPMISKAFWAKLNPAQQKLLVDVWAENIAAYRKGSHAAQASARKILEANGVTIKDPTADELTLTRKAMLAQLDVLVAEAKLSAELVAFVRQAVGSAV